MQSLNQLLSENKIILMDGGMGTMIYEKGIYINQCFDELNLKNPALITKIHEAYRSFKRPLIGPQQVNRKDT